MEPPNNKPSLSRLEKEHGGELLEAVSADELVSVNNPDCKHEKLIRDESETEFTAFTCASEDCNEVFIFAKP